MSQKPGHSQKTSRLRKGTEPARPASQVADGRKRKDKSTASQSRELSKPYSSTLTSNEQTRKRVPVPVRMKLHRRFYEAIAMLHVLGSNRGERIEEEEEENFDSEDESSGPGTCRLRRSFIENLAYLCDYETGGDSTTAIALQHTHQGIVYWVASNSRPACGPDTKDKTERFLQDILQDLEVLEGCTQEVREQIEAKLFEKCVAFSATRIATYIKSLKSTINSVLGLLKDSEERLGM